MDRKATVVWAGTGKEGKGHITTQSLAVNDASFTWHSRFEDGNGTNPEELIAAAHAACFTMKLSFLIGKEGYKSEKIETTAQVTINNEAISTSHIAVKATVPGMNDQTFQKCAEESRANCPVSKALKMEITMVAKLEKS
jgi:osmotically inducible protein OsmC